MLSRNALLFSLVLHGSTLAFVGSGTHPSLAESVPDKPGLTVAVGAEAPGTLLADNDPVSPPQSEPPTLPVPAIVLPPEVSNAAPPSQTPGLEGPATVDHTENARVDRQRTPRAVRGAPGRAGSGTGALRAGVGGNSRGYVPPNFRTRNTPAYPLAARAQRMEGAVVLLVSVDTAGRVTRVGLQRSSGHALLDAVAMEAVRSWRFDPARQDGLPVPASVEVPVRFRFS